MAGVFLCFSSRSLSSPLSASLVKKGHGPLTCQETLHKGVFYLLLRAEVGFVSSVYCSTLFYFLTSPCCCAVAQIGVEVSISLIFRFTDWDGCTEVECKSFALSLGLLFLELTTRHVV